MGMAATVLVVRTVAVAAAAVTAVVVLAVVVVAVAVTAVVVVAVTAVAVAVTVVAVVVVGDGPAGCWPILDAKVIICIYCTGWSAFVRSCAFRK
jgi:hypothetical protein